MMRRLLVSLVLVLALLAFPASGVFAETSQNVTVSASPSYICIANAPGAWTINSETGNSKLATSTTYYSNPLGSTTVPSDPVVDGECTFTITNTSSVAIDLTVNFPNFTGGDAMANGNSGSGGEGTFGAYSYCTGMTYSTGKVVAQASGSAVMKDALAATTNIMWGLTLSTQTDAWASGTAMSSTVVITAVAD